MPTMARCRHQMSNGNLGICQIPACSCKKNVHSHRQTLWMAPLTWIAINWSLTFPMNCRIEAQEQVACSLQCSIDPRAWSESPDPVRLAINGYSTLSVVSRVSSFNPRNSQFVHSSVKELCDSDSDLFSWMHLKGCNGCIRVASLSYHMKLRSVYDFTYQFEQVWLSPVVL